MCRRRTYIEADTSEVVDNPESNTAAEASEPAPLESSIDPKEETDYGVSGEPAEPVVDSAEPSAAATVPASSTDPAPGADEEESVPSPPTSPFLAAVGAAKGAPTSGHVQTGHSPSAACRPSRVRGTKSGRHKPTSDLIKLWQRDFDAFADWLFQETGFYLQYIMYIQHGDAGAELIWTIRVFSTSRAYCTSNQILVPNVFKPYRNWTFGEGRFKGCPCNRC